MLHSSFYVISRSFFEILSRRFFFFFFIFCSKIVDFSEKKKKKNVEKKRVFWIFIGQKNTFFFFNSKRDTSFVAPPGCFQTPTFVGSGLFVVGLWTGNKIPKRGKKNPKNFNLSLFQLWLL